MKFKHYFGIVFIVLAFIFTSLAYHPAYAYFDRLSTSTQGSLTLGRWKDLRTLNFANINLNDFTTRGPLNQNEQGINSGFGFLFTEINKESYVVTLEAQMSPGTSGGYGIVFDSTLNGNLHTGFVIQLDRGFGPGAIILREWINGNEQASSSPLLIARANATPGIPGRGNDPTWWTSEKTLRLEVTRLNNTEISITLFVDELLVFDNEIIESNLSLDDLYVGFRAWGTSSTFKVMTIE